jgi:hypothetical protein
MYQGNPFGEDTLTLSEAKPRIQLKKKIKAIEIQPDEDDYAAKPDLNKINEILHSIPSKEKIRLFGIDYDSNLRSLPDIDIFPNLTHAHFACRKIKDYSKLHSLKMINHLFLCNYPYLDLSGFEHLNLNDFRAIRGRIEIFNISTDTALLQNCSKIIEFGKVTIKHLMLEGYLLLLHEL